MTNLLKNKARWGIIPLAIGLLLVLAHTLLAVQYGDIQRISVALNGTEANDDSHQIIISPNGNVVFFGSSATNLLPVDGEGYRYYIFNRQSQTLQLTDIEIGYDISSKVLFNYDGHYLAHNKDNAVWLRDLQTGADELISVNKNGSPTEWESILIGISNDARYISFYSRSEDVLDDMSNCNTLFIRDRATSTTTCIPLLPGQTSGDKVLNASYGVMSPDGSKIYYHNNEDTCCNGSSLYLYETQTQDITLLDVDLTQEAAHGFYISKTNTDGSVLLFSSYILVGTEGDEHILQHRFPIYDHNTETVTYWDAREQGLVEDTPDEDHIYQAYPIAISDDGRYLAGRLVRFHIDMRLWSIRSFIYDRMTNTSTRILNTNGDNAWGEETILMAADSKLTTLGFASDETNLISGDTNNRRDVFLAFVEPEIPTPAELLINGSMDDNNDAVSKLPDGWTKVGSLKDDRVRADNDSFTYAHSAPNTFQFTGTKAEVGVASKLTQQVNLAGKTIKKGDVLTFSAMVDQRAGIPGTPIAKAVVLYNNGTKQVYTLKLATPKVTGYAPISISKALTRGGVKSLKVELFYAKANGKFYIDDVSLTHMPASAALVPLP